MIGLKIRYKKPTPKMIFKAAVHARPTSRSRPRSQSRPAPKRVTKTPCYRNATPSTTRKLQTLTLKDILIMWSVVSLFLLCVPMSAILAPSFFWAVILYPCLVAAGLSVGTYLCRDF